MSQERTRQEPYLLDAGPLGHLEGLTVFNQIEDKSLLHYFGGLPYALPPIGPYRFRRPRPLPECYRYGNVASPGRFNQGTAECPQPGGRTDGKLWDEDCLQLNIYLPAGEAPAGGWPVLFNIHGGFLQWGDPNNSPLALVPLLSETSFRAIIIQPAYRLNAFGFLASREIQAEARSYGETVANVGFWDQRIALEWVAKNIKHFQGNPNNITVAGYSAGSYSTFHQLAHELYFVPDDEAIIKRIIMWSNSPGVQPKTLPEQQKQFDELLTSLGISGHLKAVEKLERLRQVPFREIVAVQDRLKLSEFRPWSDGAFISKSLMADINNGDFARRIKARGIVIMNGECRDEHNAYQFWRTPASTFDAVYTRLCADYPEQAVIKLCDYYLGPSRKLPTNCHDWSEVFGRLYANMQVHSLERGFHDALMRGGLQPGKDLLRYRIDWRLKAVDQYYPIEMGVTHGTDLAIWFWGLDFKPGVTTEERRVLQPWNDAFASFVRGDHVTWGTSTVQEMKRLNAQGETDIWIDDRWAEGVGLWQSLNDPSQTSLLSWIRSKL